MNRRHTTGSKSNATVQPKGLEIYQGLWYDIHRRAILCETQDQAYKERFCQFIDEVPLVLPCNKCVTHFIEHLEKYPIRKYIALPDGMYMWTWNLHNLVNLRLGKPILGYQESRKLYQPDVTCTGN